MKEILFIDDEINILKSVSRILKDVNPEWNISFSNSLEEIITNIKLFDLIFIDIAMPKINGLDFIYKHAEEINKAKIIVMSGMQDKDIRALALAGGIYKYLEKPVSKETLISTITEFFAR